MAVLVMMVDGLVVMAEVGVDVLVNGSKVVMGSVVEIIVMVEVVVAVVVCGLLFST